MSQEWPMPRRGEACAACSRAFEVGEKLRACLYECNTGYERRDFCPPCTPTGEPQPLASWLTRRPEPNARKTLAFDRQAVLGFFQRLADADTPERLQFRFVLALLLWRKKVLRFDRAVPAAGGEAWRFVLAGTGEAYLVQRPDLDEDQIEGLSAQLEALLSGDPSAAGSELIEEPADA